MKEELYFEVKSCLDKRIRVTKPYWNKIIKIKHNVIEGKEAIAKETIKKPDEIRRSSKDKEVFLHYKKINKNYLCVVTKHLDGEGFIITAYITDRIKIGEKYETN